MHCPIVTKLGVQMHHGSPEAALISKPGPEVKISRQRDHFEFRFQGISRPRIPIYAPNSVPWYKMELYRARSGQNLPVVKSEMADCDNIENRLICNNSTVIVRFCRNFLSNKWILSWPILSQS